MWLRSDGAASVKRQLATGSALLVVSSHEIVLRSAGRAVSGQCAPGPADYRPANRVVALFTSTAWSCVRFVYMVQIFLFPGSLLNMHEQGFLGRGVFCFGCAECVVGRRTCAHIWTAVWVGFDGNVHACGTELQCFSAFFDRGLSQIYLEICCMG